MPRPLLAATLVLATACAASQAGNPELEPQQMQEVFRQYFTAPGPQMARVTLEQGFYRVNIDKGGVQMRLRPVSAGTQVPMVRDLLPGGDIQGGRTLEVQVYATGEYQVEVTGGTPGAETEVIMSRIVGKTTP